MTADDDNSNTMISLTAGAAFERGLREDAEVRDDDRARAQRLLRGGAFLEETQQRARVAGTSRLAWAAAAAVVLLATGFASARVIDWMRRSDDHALPTRSPAPIRAPAPPPTVEPAPSARDVATRTPSPTPSPAALFEAANRARAAHQWPKAERLYEQLQGRHPRAPEAQLSWVSLGRLRLDQGRARAALQAFDAYLAGRGRGPLDHEALAGRALALEMLGRSAEEAAAWHALLARFPDTLFKAKAAARLAQLERAH